ncbi:MAG: hypothetical protein ACSHW0_19565, partial [Thalassotalea sp.]
ITVGFCSCVAYFSQHIICLLTRRYVFNQSTWNGVHMKHSKNIGIICGTLGLLSGVYFGLLPIIQSFNFGVISSQQAGMYSATTATILGLSVATICALYHYSSKNT